MRRVRLIALAALVMATPRFAAGQTPVRLASRTDTTSAAALARADRAFAAKQWHEAAELYQGALAVDDGAPQRWWSLAHALFNERRHREAIAAYERALQLGAGEPATGAWQIARAYALEGNRKQALRWLGHAVAAGFDGREAIRREPAFEAYRGDPRFTALSAVSVPARRSPLRFPVSRTWHAPIQEMERPGGNVRTMLAGAAGFEPATSRVTAGRSAN
jgi:tetratricopeptide (TPR) repeat protein